MLDGRAGGSRARSIVRPQSQKTDAKMMTNSLLLSDEAEASQKPELEIFADDVQCGHGATSGALDQNLKFYLMSRGIPEVEAEALLVQAFVGDASRASSTPGCAMRPDGRCGRVAQRGSWIRCIPQ